MKFIYSIKNAKDEAITTKNHKIKFFLANIQEYDPETEFEKYIAYLIAIEFHELGHYYNCEIGCDNHNILCPWCEETEKVFQYILNT